MSFAATGEEEGMLGLVPQNDLQLILFSVVTNIFLTSTVLGEGEATAIVYYYQLSLSRVLGVGIYGSPSSLGGDFALITAAAFQLVLIS